VLFNKHYFFFREEMASASQQFNRKDTKFDASGQNRSLDIKIDDFDISFGDK
jgi:ATP-binding cassette subfamily F protein 3